MDLHSPFLNISTYFIFALRDERENKQTAHFTASTQAHTRLGSGFKKLN